MVAGLYICIAGSISLLSEDVRWHLLGSRDRAAYIDEMPSDALERMAVSRHWASMMVPLSDWYTNRTTALLTLASRHGVETEIGRAFQEQALAALREQSFWNPSAPDAWIRKALIHHRRGEPDLVVRNLRRAWQNAPFVRPLASVTFVAGLGYWNHLDSADKNYLAEALTAFEAADEHFIADLELSELLTQRLDMLRNAATQ